MFIFDVFYCYRWMFGLAAVPAIVQFIGFIFLPESPRWLVANGKSYRAHTVLVNIRGTSDIELEMKEIELSVEEDRKERDLAGVDNKQGHHSPPDRKVIKHGSGLKLKIK